MNLLQTIDFTAVIGLIAVVTAIILLIYKATKAPKGILCTECGNRRVTLASKQPIRLMTSAVANRDGHGTAQVRYKFTYKCPDCFAENSFESGYDE